MAEIADKMQDPVIHDTIEIAEWSFNNTSILLDLVVLGVVAWALYDKILKPFLNKSEAPAIGKGDDAQILDRINAMFSRIDTIKDDHREDYTNIKTTLKEIAHTLELHQEQRARLVDKIDAMAKTLTAHTDLDKFNHPISRRD